jgi:ankyrin repeat protein
MFASMHTIKEHLKARRVSIACEDPSKEGDEQDVGILATRLLQDVNNKEALIRVQERNKTKLVTMQSALINSLESERDVNNLVLVQEMESALMKKDADLMEKCIAAGCSPDFESDTGITPLIFAVVEGHITLIGKLVITYKASLDRENKFGSTALIWAAMLCNTEIMTELIRLGANINLETRCGRSALLSACVAGKEASIIKCVQSGCPISQHCTSNAGFSPLMCAAASGNTKAVQLLLQLGAPVEASDMDNMTAYSWALTSLYNKDEILHLIESRMKEPPDRLFVYKIK